MMARSLAWLVAGLALVCGCSTNSSDDPREGGLIGYWQHGDQGYQQRLEQREADLDAVQQQGESEQSQTARLQQQRDAARSELARQRTALAELSREVAGLQQSFAELNVDSAESTREKQAVVEEADTLHKKIAGLEQDTELLIRERQRRIAELNKELKLLRERASMLTAL